ncbi:hypothetical protein GOBAR_AA21415 [Gossypium barbadense]|uniref:Uncharacterized protein n=1 Tax=Gossypium barbadense TaxID=3634 RepID=A0A2P5X7F1_GOSBA|nr:hypothetical protein GOBAR_AA21415 [Gossypium barbadense]
MDASCCEGGEFEIGTEENLIPIKVRFRDKSDDSSGSMLVDLPSLLRTSLKDMLLGISSSVLGNSLVEDEKIDLLEGDIKKSVINEIPSIEFSERIQQILSKVCQDTRTSARYSWKLEELLGKLLKVLKPVSEIPKPSPVATSMIDEGSGEEGGSYGPWMLMGRNTRQKSRVIKITDNTSEDSGDKDKGSGNKSNKGKEILGINSQEMVDNMLDKGLWRKESIVGNKTKTGLEFLGLVTISFVHSGEEYSFLGVGVAEDINILLERLNFEGKINKDLLRRMSMILIKFGAIEDRTQILNLSPWLLDQYLFAMLSYVKDQELDAYAFNILPFWLRIFNIPLKYMDRQVVLDIVTNKGKKWVHNLERQGKAKNAEEESISCSLMEKCQQRTNWEGAGKMKCKRKRLKVSNRENTNESPIRPIRRKLADSLLPSLLWREEVEMACQNYLNHHIDSLVSMDDNENLHFMGFYGHADPNSRKRSWDILRRVGGAIREGWMVGSDFYAIINDVENEGGRRKPRTIMDYFRELLEELSLVDIKTNNGWFTWVNNREGMNMVKERLDRFLVSTYVIENMSYLVAKVVRQLKPDHDAILMDTMGSKPFKNFRNPRLILKYDA